MKTKIFVSVGSTFPLDRLIEQIDSLDLNKFEIFAQIGETKYSPKNIKSSKFLDYDKLQQKIIWADLIITHAGIGTIIDCLTQNKKIILFPRLKKFGESIDDHQLEICKVFNKKYHIEWAANEKELKNLIKTNKKIKIIKKENKLVKEIERLIE